MTSVVMKRFAPYTPSRERVSNLKGRKPVDLEHGRSINYYRETKKSPIGWSRSSPSFTSAVRSSHRGSSSTDIGGSDSDIKLLPPEKCKLIMCRIYDLNRSGSKKILIGLDVEDGLRPKLFIAKNGNVGVSISEHVWASLMDQKLTITDYFEREESSSVNTNVVLCENIHINFIKLHGEKIIQVVKNNHYCVYLGRESWCGLIGLYKCVQNAIEEICEWSAQTNSVTINDIVRSLKLYISSACNGCDGGYLNNTHDCVNVDFIVKQIDDYVECYDDIDGIEDTSENYDCKFPRKRFLYELYKQNPDLLIQLVTKE